MPLTHVEPHLNVGATTSLARIVQNTSSFIDEISSGNRSDEVVAATIQLVWTYPEKCVLTIAICVVIAFTAAGNLLTIVAIVRDRTLRSVTYSFLGSLATADLLVAILVMPFSMLWKVTYDGIWTFGPILCDVWQFTDYVCCTASLTNLCNIAMDRYNTIRQPLRAMRNRTRGRAAVMIAVTWLVPVISWAVFITLTRTLNGYTDRTVCTLLWKPCFLAIVAAIVTIYVPVITIITLFIMIFISLRAHASKLSDRMRRRSWKRSMKSITTDESGVCVNDESITPTSQLTSLDPSALVEISSPATPETAPYCCGLISVELEHDPAVRLGYMEAELDSTENSDGEQLYMFIYNEARWNYVTFRTVATNTSSEWKFGRTYKSIGVNTSPIQCRDRAVPGSPVLRARSAPNLHETIKLTGKGSRSKPSYARSGTRQSASGSQLSPSVQDKTLSANSNSDPDSGRLSWGSYADAMRKRRQEELERSRLWQQVHTARTLAVISAVLLLCWLPFAVLWPVSVYCPECVQKRIYAISIWINYLNSSVNPILYCLCNRTFRAAVKRILRR